MANNSSTRSIAKQKVEDNKTFFLSDIEKLLNANINTDDNKVPKYTLSANPVELTTNSDITVKVSDAAELLGVSKQAVQKNCKSGKYSTVTSYGKGGKHYLIFLSSLPVEAQQRYYEKIESLKIMNKIKIAKSGYNNTINPITNLSNLANKRVVFELDIVSLALSSPPSGMKLTDYKTYIAHSNGIDLATLYRWIKKHTTTEKRTVIKNGIEINFSEFRNFSGAALDWAVGRRMTYPMESIENTYRELKKESIKKEWKIGSIKRFYVAMSRIPQALIIASKEGQRGLDNKIAPMIERDYSCYSPLELVCGDQMISDYYCYNNYGEIVTPEFYMWIDMGTSMILGIAMTLGRYNKYLIGESLKQVCSYGIPQQIYTDNGKPELSNYLKDVLFDLKGCEYNYNLNKSSLNRHHKKAKPRNSKAKPIESYFSHIQKKLLSITKCKGYKKYEKGDLGLLKQENLKKIIKDKKLMSLEEFACCVLEAVEWWNSHYNKSRKIIAKEAFYLGLQKKPRPQLSEDLLEYMFLPRKKYTVRNSSVVITIENESCRFYSEKLAFYHGKKIEVRWSPNDLNKVYLIDSSELIDIAIYKGKINPKSNKDVAQALEDKQAVIKTFLNLRKKYMGKYKSNILGLSKHSRIVKEIDRIKTNKSNIAISPEERDAILDKFLGIV